MKALVLNSGGVDSTTCVGIAVKSLGKENVATVSVYYGQKHSKELECAKRIAEHYDVPHYELDLSGILQYSNCSLLKNSTEAICHESYAEQIAKDGEGMVRTYVPFRNGLLLSSVTALAVSIFPDEDVQVYLGAHADDAAGQAYADCSSDFTEAIGAAISIGTYGRVSLAAPLVDLNKAGVVKIGLELGVPYELTWSCYEGGEQQCGTCGTCIDRKAAFIANGVEDPVTYAE
ncbi:MAG: 7-cyano-7-deazaguanine synthase QueC [Cellulosilyticaceae bacterium]